jgi:hypothetical protein
MKGRVSTRTTNTPITSTPYGVLRTPRSLRVAIEKIHHSLEHCAGGQDCIFHFSIMFFVVLNNAGTVTDEEDSILIFLSHMSVIAVYHCTH